MYFPFFRGKQFELVCIRELIPQLSTPPSIIPIIEPVKRRTSSLRRTLEELSKAEVESIVVYNPKVGEFTKHAETDKEKKYADYTTELPDLLTPLLDRNPKLIPAYILSEMTLLDDVAAFLGHVGNSNIALIHFGEAGGDLLQILSEAQNRVLYNVLLEGSVSAAYSKELPVETVVTLRDGFEKQRTNADYPPLSYFSDMHLKFEELGYIGFGDFLIVGKEYSDSAGPAYTVAIHLTYLRDNGSLGIRHFLSDSYETQANPGGKFLEALRKAVAFVNSVIGWDAVNFTGAHEFIRLNEEEHYPGLGSVKKTSMKHHVQLIRSIL